MNIIEEFERSPEGKAQRKRERESLRRSIMELELAGNVRFDDVEHEARVIVLARGYEEGHPGFTFEQRCVLARLAMRSVLAAEDPTCVDAVRYHLLVDAENEWNRERMM